MAGSSSTTRIRGIDRHSSEEAMRELLPGPTHDDQHRDGVGPGIRSWSLGDADTDVARGEVPRLLDLLNLVEDNHWQQEALSCAHPPPDRGSSVAVWVCDTVVHGLDDLLLRARRLVEKEVCASLGGIGERGVDRQLDRSRRLTSSVDHVHDNL